MFVITDIGKLFLFFTYHDNHIIHGSRILFFFDYGSQKINSVDHVSRETLLRPLYEDQASDLGSFTIECRKTKTKPITSIRIKLFVQSQIVVKPKPKLMPDHFRHSTENVAMKPLQINCGV